MANLRSNSQNLGSAILDSGSTLNVVNGEIQNDLDTNGYRRVISRRFSILLCLIIYEDYPSLAVWEKLRLLAARMHSAGVGHQALLYNEAVAILNSSTTDAYVLAFSFLQ